MDVNNIDSRVYPRLRTKGQNSRSGAGIVAEGIRGVTPGGFHWAPFPAFPDPVRLAVLVGDIIKPSLYVIRVKVPAGVKLMPHAHPEDRIYTVISGLFYIGLGKTFDPEQLKAYPPGSVIVLPGNAAHFHWAKSGEYISQITGTGPLGINYVDSRDDPRKQ